VPSALTWLDSSAEAQRRIREIVKLFIEVESRDELGIGQIRDVYSNRLFPGVSVIQTRARYFLFVPWLYQRHTARGHRGAQLRQRVVTSERKLIDALRSAGDTNGLIGLRVGSNLKVPPSTIYWSGLRRLGILTTNVDPDELGWRGGLREDDVLDELAERHVGDWHPTLPAPPPGFPDAVDDGFRMTRDEASWLRDIIVEHCPATLLAHLVTSPQPPRPETLGPWDEPLTHSATPEILEIVEQARQFSLVMHGAALLYNLLLAEAYEDAGHDRFPELAQVYRSRLRDWTVTVEAELPVLREWDMPLWQQDILRFNPRIAPGTLLFVQRWLETAFSVPAAVADSPIARELITQRERMQKKGQARLQNPRLLALWNGSSASSPLTYRWGTVVQLLTDIVTPLEDVVASA